MLKLGIKINCFLYVMVRIAALSKFVELKFWKWGLLLLLFKYADHTTGPVLLQKK